MGDIMLYLQAFIDFIMKLLSFFKKSDNTETGGNGKDNVTPEAWFTESRIIPDNKQAEIFSLVFCI